MKFAELKSIGHNIADSLASGIGLMIGVYDMDVFGEAKASSNGQVEVDFLGGEVLSGEVSQSLRKAIQLYAKALPEMCERHGMDIGEFERLTAVFPATPIPEFTVTVADRQGRSSTDRYVGIPGARPKVIDDLGRVRKA